MDSPTLMEDVMTHFGVGYDYVIDERTKHG